MHRRPYDAGMPSRVTPGARARELTDVITRMRRALRRSIRLDYPWEARPMAQIEVLQMLQDTGPIRLRDLAERLNLAQSTVSSLVGRLLTAGLVQRATDQHDRRAARIQLTPAGQQHLGEWDDAHRQRLGRALRSLAAADRSKVQDALPALGRLADALNSDSHEHRSTSASAPLLTARSRRT